MNNIDEASLEQLKKKYYGIYISVLIQNNTYFYRSLAFLAIFEELDSISSKSKDEMIQYVRLTWWREAFDDHMNGVAVNHPLIKNIGIINNAELAYLNNIICSFENEIENKQHKSIIIDRYNSLLNLVNNSNIEMPDHILTGYFLLIEIFFKRKIKNLNKLDFFLAQNFNTQIYIKAIVEKLLSSSLEYLNNKDTKSDLFIYLNTNSILFYLKKTLTYNCDIYLYNHNIYRFTMLISSYWKYIYFKVFLKSKTKIDI